MNEKNENQFENISSILNRVLTGIKDNESGKDTHDILDEWPVMIGKPFSEFTKPLRLKNGILTIQVNSTAILQEFRNYGKYRLLQTLNEKWPEIKDIKFKAY